MADTERRAGYQGGFDWQTLQDRREEELTLENVPGFQRPMAAGPMDRIIGVDELTGSPVRQTAIGTEYTVRRNPDQRTARQKAEDWYNNGAQLPTLGQIGQAITSIPGAVYDSARASLAGTASLGEVMGFAPAMGAVGAMQTLPEGAIPIFGGIRARRAPVDQIPANSETLSFLRGVNQEGSTTWVQPENLTIEKPTDQFRQTGWYLGPDEKLRFEIPTYWKDWDLQDFQTANPTVEEIVDNVFTKHEWQGTNSTVKLQYTDLEEQEAAAGATNAVPLNEIFRNEAVFENYPDLKTLPVVLTEGLPSSDGMYSPLTDIIYISKNFVDNHSPEDLVRTITHEVQHAVQTREAFTRGGSPESTTEFKEYQDAMVSVNEQRDRLQKGYQLGKIDFKTYQNRLDDLGKQERSIMFDLYERIYGEEEARAAAARIGWTDERRQTQFPEETGRLTRTTSSTEPTIDPTIGEPFGSSFIQRRPN